MVLQKKVNGQKPDVMAGVFVLLAWIS